MRTPCWRSTASSVRRAPTVEAAETLMNNLFFDPRRYDLSVVGRYKFNKKLSLWQRVTGYKLAPPVADPATGELLFDEGHLLSKEDARLLDTVGVAEVVILVDDQPLRVQSNKMCDMSRYVDFDPKECCGIKERVRFDVLQELLGQYSGEELMEQCKAPRRRSGAQAHHRGRHSGLHQLYERSGPRTGHQG